MISVEDSREGLTSLYAVSMFIDERAEVVELVDALRSGRSGCKPVGVRVPPSAHKKTARRNDAPFFRFRPY
jgi:hypothetical protein